MTHDRVASLLAAYFNQSYVEYGEFCSRDPNDRRLNPGGGPPHQEEGPLRRCENDHSSGGSNRRVVFRTFLISRKKLRPPRPVRFRDFY
jgi:hypothetical protein